MNIIKRREENLCIFLFSCLLFSVIFVVSTQSSNRQGCYGKEVIKRRKQENTKGEVNEKRSWH